MVAVSNILPSELGGLSFACNYRKIADHSSGLKKRAGNRTNGLPRNQTKGLPRIGPKSQPASTMRLRGLAPQMVTAIRVHALVRKLSRVYVYGWCRVGNSEPVCAQSRF